MQKTLDIKPQEVFIIIGLLAIGGGLFFWVGPSRASTVIGSLMLTIGLSGYIRK